MLVEICFVRTVHGRCVTIGLPNSGHSYRLAGEKAWGGGHDIATFHVDSSVIAVACGASRSGFVSINCHFPSTSLDDARLTLGGIVVRGSILQFADDWRPLDLKRLSDWCEDANVEELRRELRNMELEEPEEVHGAEVYSAPIVEGGPIEQGDADD
jgi:hypothetical protein